MAPKPAKAGKHAEKPKTPPPPPPKPKKPFEEISAIFNGNEVKIRVPKSTAKPPKLTPSQLKLQQSCTCEDDSSICSETCGIPCGKDGGPSNRLDFQIPDDICESLTHRTALNSELVYTKTAHHENLCKVCSVKPKMKVQKTAHPDKDVFLLKIGKQTDEPHRTGNIEVELVTPRVPAKPPPERHACIQIQCEEKDIPCPCTGPCGACCQTMMPRKRKCRRLKCCRPCY
ncbi:hypothetical protein PYW07_009025 [Mythimna separata]|uniref:Uncharacterized protein n=1 Tax=Mythimna separata TaxID=271217 RepID=A0AAD7YB61_MYTSE|nr:hypothetical protein PYW07_009025 [Mythimna separata]